VELVCHGGPRHHAGPHRALLEVVQHARQVAELGHGPGIDREALAEHAPHPEVGRGRLPDQPDQLVEPPDRDHDRFRRPSGRLAKGGAVPDRTLRARVPVVAGPGVPGVPGSVGLERIPPASRRPEVRLESVGGRRAVLPGEDRGTISVRPSTLTKQGVDQPGRGEALAAAELLEQVFHDVGDPAHVVDADDGGGSLEVVGLAEDGRDQLLVAARLLKGQQLLTEPAEAHLGLLGEQVPELLLVADVAIRFSRRQPGAIVST